MQSDLSLRARWHGRVLKRRTRARISFGIDWPAIYWARVPLWQRLVSCCGIAVQKQRRFMRRSILRPCAHSACLGREVCNEHTSPSSSELFSDAPRSGIQVASCRQRFARLRHLHGKATGGAHHPTSRAPVGTAAEERSTGNVGSTIRLCPWICPVLQFHRSTHGDSTVRLDAVPAAPSEALPLQQRGN